MVKRICVIYLFIFAFSLNAFSQDKKVLFLKQYFAAETLLKLSIKFNDNEENFNLFTSEANKAAIRAENLFDEIELSLRSKLTSKDLLDIKNSIKALIDRSAEISSSDKQSLAKLSLYFQLLEIKQNAIFAKLLK